jgi:imidazolonepropionase-like amidohydrolase
MTAATAIVWMSMKNNSMSLTIIGGNKQAERGVFTAPQSGLSLHGSLGQRSLSLLVVGLLLLVGLANATAESLLLSNAIVHTVSGETLSRGQILINGSKIQAVGTNLTESVDRVIDLKGQHVYPGLIALDSALGLTEIEAVRSTRDMTEVGDYRPDVQSWIAVNPDSELLPVSRANGITHAEPAPQGGVMGGLSGVIAMDGWTTEQMTIKRPAAFHIYWPDMTLDTKPKEKFKDPSKFKSLEDQARERTAKINALDDFLREARAYATSREAIKKSGSPDSGINPPWEAMLPVVRGELPIMVHADEFRQIKAALRWARTNQYDIILVGGREAWMAADILSSSKVPVIFEHAFSQPGRDWTGYDVQFRTPELLRRAGVKVAFSEGSGSFNAALTKNLPYSAAQAVAFGLPEDEAIKGITLYPAQLLRVADRLGSIEPGKEATLFVADGSILDIRANVKQMWIAGREMNLESRHTRLYQKYKNRPRAN